MLQIGRRGCAAAARSSQWRLQQAVKRSASVTTPSSWFATRPRLRTTSTGTEKPAPHSQGGAVRRLEAAVVEDAAQESSSSSSPPSDWKISTTSSTQSATAITATPSTNNDATILSNNTIDNSSATTTSLHTTLQDVESLLRDRPLGSLNPEEWRSLRHCVQQRMVDGSTAIDAAAGGDELLRRGFSLLDRLVAEAQARSGDKSWRREALVGAGPASSLEEGASSSSSSLSVEARRFSEPWVLRLWRHAIVESNEEAWPAVLEVVRLVETYLQHGYLPWSPHVATWIVDVIGVTENQKRAPMLATEIVQRLVDAARRASQARELEPLCDKFLTTRLAKLWADSHLPEAPHRATQLLDNLRAVYEQQHVAASRNAAEQPWASPPPRRTHRHADAAFLPDAHVYAAVLLAWARARTEPAAGVQAWRLFSQAVQEYSCRPTAAMYAAVIRALTRPADGKADIDAAQLAQARDLFDSLVHRWKDAVHTWKEEGKNAPSLQPIPATYAPILEAYHRTGQVRKSLDLLREMRTLALKHRIYVIRPDEPCVQYGYKRLLTENQNHSMARRVFQQYPAADPDIHEPGNLEATEWGDIIRQLASLGAALQEPLTDAQAKYDDIHAMLVLLDRLALEIAWHASHEAEPPAVTSFLNGDQCDLLSQVLEQTLEAWSYCFGERGRQPRDERRYLMNMGDVLRRVRYYQETRLLQPTDQTLLWILRAMHNWGEGGPAPARTAQYIVDMAVRDCHNDAQHKYHPQRSVMTKLTSMWGESKLDGDEVGEAVEGNLQRVQEWYHLTNRAGMRPDNELYAAVIGALVLSQAEEAPQKVAQRAQKLLREYVTHYGAPNALLYCAVGQALGKAGATEELSALMDNMVQQYASSEEQEVSFHEAAKNLSFVAMALDPVAKPGMVDDFLRHMETHFLKTGNVSFLANCQSYSLVIKGYGQAKEPELAQAVLYRMLDLASAARSAEQHLTAVPIEPNRQSWNSAIQAWAKSRLPESADRASAILNDMDARKHALGGVEPVTFTLNCVLESYYLSPNPEKYADTAHNLLASMESSGNPSMMPDAQTYNFCLLLCQEASLGDQGKQILGSMCRRYLDGEKGSVIPKKQHFETVLCAYAPHSLAKVKEVLKLMNDMHAQHGMKIRPDKETFRQMIGWVQKQNVDNAASISGRLLKVVNQLWKAGDQHIAPDTAMYNIVMGAWVDSDEEDAPKQVERLFAGMRADGIKPNVTTYIRVMQAYAKHGRPEKVEEHFNDMMTKWKKGNKSLKPSFNAYSILLEAWAEAGKPDRATAVLKQMLREHGKAELEGKQLTPHFASVVRAWESSNRPDAPVQAEKFVEKMEEISINGTLNCRPDRNAFASAIAAHAKSADRLLHKLKLTYNETGNPAFQPDMEVYKDVIGAYAALPDGNHSNRIGELIGELGSLSEDAWKGQGKDACSVIVNAIRTSSIPQTDKERHIAMLGNLVQQVLLDAKR